MIISEYGLTCTDIAPVLEFIKRLCLQLSDCFPEREKLQIWCIFDNNAICNADFCFSHDKIEMLVKQYKIFLPTQDQEQLEENLTYFINKTKNVYNDLKYIVKASSGNITLKDLAAICLKDESKFSTILCFIKICLTFQASNADCERGFSLMNLVKTKNRNRLEPNHLNQIMMVKSMINAKKSRSQDMSTPEIDLVKVYLHLKGVKRRRINIL